MKITANDIRAECERLGLRFKPWEFPRPWEIADDATCDLPPGLAGADWWPTLIALRKRLIRRIRNAKKAPKKTGQAV